MTSKNWLFGWIQNCLPSQQQWMHHHTFGGSINHLYWLTFLSFFTSLIWSIVTLSILILGDKNGNSGTYSATTLGLSLSLSSTIDVESSLTNSQTIDFPIRQSKNTWFKANNKCSLTYQSWGPQNPTAWVDFFGPLRLSFFSHILNTYYCISLVTFLLCRYCYLQSTFFFLFQNSEVCFMINY